MSPREASLLGRLSPDAFVVEIAALLDVLGTEHDTVRLRIARDKAALFAQDLRAGQAACGLARSSAREALLPDHIEATIRTRAGIDVQLTDWMARAVAHALDVGRRIRLGLPPPDAAPFAAPGGKG